ncbi:unnamed protein product [Aphanomyces euteiches]
MASAGSSHTESGVKTEKTTSHVALFRIVLNVAAGTLVILPIIAVVMLLSQSMFERLVVSVNTQTRDHFWADYGKSCMLSANGWVPNTCDAATLAIVPDKIFAAIGVAFGQQWSREIAKAGGKLYVTTCLIGGTSDIGWANLQFVAGYDYFPACVPDAPQDVAGMAMFETTVQSQQSTYRERRFLEARDEFTNIYYAFTLYSDLDPNMTVYKYANSDGTSQDLIANPKRTLITLDGQLVEDTKEGLNAINDSKALGSRYTVRSYCLMAVEELSQIAIDQGLTGWSQGILQHPHAEVNVFVGKHSKHPVVPGWICGHQVKNFSELIVLQFFFAAATLVLFAGDIVITFEGLRGVLQGKPVLTYSILSGLERRKLLLVFIVLNAMPGLVYADIARIYFFTTNGFKIWCLSIIIVANFFSFGLVLAVSLLDMIPLRLKHVVSYSAPVFLSASITAISIACCKDSVFQYATNMIYASPTYITLHANDADWPCGSYTADGLAPSVKHIIDSIVQPLVVSFVCSIVVSTIYRLVAHKRVFMALGWCKTNSFLTFAKTPNFITALPLEQTNAVKIGNKMYCKPSTQALMGYATVVETKYKVCYCSSCSRMDSPVLVVASDENNAMSPLCVISIYALVASMLFPNFVEQHGTITHNEFTPKTKAQLEKKKYKHTRGACVV